MKKLLFLIAAVILFAGCEKEEELYTIKTQGDFTGECYTLGAMSVFDPAGDFYYAWLSSTPYNGQNCFISVLGSYSNYQEFKQNYWGNTEKATYIMKGQRLNLAATWQESVNFDEVIVTWNEKITKEEYDKLYSFYNEKRFKEVDDGHGGRTKVTIYDKAEKVNVER
ncbi:MAG: hypothetical protein MJ198_00985 [Bacteroidales bacterium]|nr:hypothetical protein [Bacteroidales bacterium]